MISGTSVRHEEVLLNAGLFLFFLSIHSIAPYISQYAVSLGASEREVALLGPALSIVAITLRPLSGYLVDKGRLKHVTLIGLSFSTLSQLVYMLSAGVIHLYIGRCLQGIGVAFFIPASIYAAALAGKAAASALAWRSTMIGLAMSVGPAFGGLLLSSFGYRALFSCVIALLIFSLVLNSIALASFSTSEREVGGGHFADLLNSSFLAASSAIFAYSMTYNSLMLFLPAHYKSIGLGATATAAVFSTAAAANFASRLLFSLVSSRAKYQLTALAGFCLFTSGLALLVLDPLSRYVLLCSVIVGIGGGVLIPSLQIMAILGVRSRSRGRASGVYTAMFDAGNMVGPPLAISLGGTYLGALRASLFLSLAGAAGLSTYLALSLMTSSRTRPSQG